MATEKPKMYDSKAQGYRLKMLREALRLSRTKFSKKHNIPVSNLQNWEEGRYQGITQDGVERMIEAFSQEGIQCRKEWILYGAGKAPELPGGTEKDALASLTFDDVEITQKELILFHQLNANAIDITVADTAMEPRLLKGDHVAGRRRFGKKIKTILENICIVQTDSGENLVRQVKAGKTAGHYHLIALNSEIKPRENVALFSAAPVVRVWRKEIKK